MKRLIKICLVPAVMLAAAVFASPKSADASYGCGYGYGFYRPYYYNSYYFPSYYNYYPTYGYGGFCY